MIAGQSGQAELGDPSSRTWWRQIIHGLLDATPFIFVVGALIVLVFGYVPIYVQSLLFLLPAIAIPLFIARRHARGDMVVTCALSLALLWLGFGVVQIYAGRVFFPDLALARLGQDAACLTLALAAIVDPRPAGERLLRMGMACVLSLLMVDLCLFSGYIASFPFGNPNYTVAALAPGVALAFGVSLQHPRPWRRAAYGLGIVAIYLYFVFGATPGDMRRGMALAGVAAVAVVIWDAIRVRWPILAWSVVGMAAIAVIAMLIWLFQEPVTSIRNDRIFLYSSAWSAGWEWAPWGRGPYAMLGLEFATSDMARERIACGHWALHAHMELLDAFLRHGWPGVVMLVAGCVGILACALRVRERSLRVPLLCWCAAMAVLLMTDNGYGLLPAQIWSAYIAGVTLAAYRQQRLREVAAASGRGDQRVAAIVGVSLAIASASVFFREAPGVGLSMTSDREQRIAAARSSRLPEVVRIEGEEVLEQLIGAEDFEDLLAIDAIMEGKLKGTTASPFYADFLYRRHSQAFFRHITSNWDSAFRAGRLPGTLALLRAWRAVDGRVLQLHLRIVRRLPFNAVFHQQLGEILRWRPDLAMHVPENIQLRCRHYLGDPGCEPPVFHQQWNGIDDAADDLAGVAWLTINGAAWSEISPHLQRVAERYPHVNDVALWTLRSRVAASAADLPWVEDLLPRLAIGMVWTSDNRRVLMTHFVQTAAEAHQAWPILSRLFPELARKIETGERAVPLLASDWHYRLCFDLIEIHALARQHLRDHSR